MFNKPLVSSASNQLSIVDYFGARLSKVLTAVRLVRHHQSPTLHATSFRGVAMFSSKKSIEITRIVFLTSILGLSACTKKVEKQELPKKLEVSALEVVKETSLPTFAPTVTSTVSKPAPVKIKTKPVSAKPVLPTPKAVVKKVVVQKVSEKVSATQKITLKNESAQKEKGLPVKSETLAKPIVEEIKPTVRPSMTFSSTISTSLHEMDDPRKVVVNTTSIGFGFALKNGPRLSTKLAMHKNLKGLREQSLKDSYLAASKSLWKITKSLSLSGSAVVLLPISERSREISMLQTGYILSPSLSLDLSAIGLKGASLFYKPSFGQNFHRMEVSNSGSSNTQFSISQSAGISYSPAEKWSLGFEGSYGKYYTYQGNESDSYSLDQYVSYAPIRNLGLTLSHSRGGNVLAVNGKDYDIELFNADNSSVSFGMSYTYR